MMPANELAAVIVKALDAKKGENIQLLKTRELTTLADYFVICTASSSTHVKTLTDAVEARKFYDLERLWSDAEVVDISDMRA